MTKVILYILKSSNNRNKITCPVPIECADAIFFGPCKKRLREWLKKEYLLKNNTDDYIVKDEDIFILGIHGANKDAKREGVRNIVWTGRINRIMTFECAYRKLTGGKYNVIRTSVATEKFPLHVEPIYYSNSNEFRGYKLVSKEHEEYE